MQQCRRSSRSIRPSLRTALRATGSALVLGALVGACASTAPPRVAVGGTTTEMSSTTGLGETVRGDDLTLTALAYGEPAARVWPALQRALTANGLPLDVVDPNTRTAGTPATRVRRTLGTARLSTYLRCGGSAGVGDVADDYLVTLGILGTVKPAGADSSTIEMRVAGSAKNPFNSTPPRECVSTGLLEMKVDSTIKAMLGRA